MGFHKLEQLSTIRPYFKPATVAEVMKLAPSGSWKTRTGTTLSLLLNEPFEILQKRFLNYSKDELKLTRRDLMGLRIFHQKSLGKGVLTGGEFHRIRRLYIFVLKGAVNWHCQDIYREETTYMTRPLEGIFIPNFIFYRAEGMKKSDFIALANTTYDPNDPLTHDTYYKESFDKLSREFRHSKSLRKPSSRLT